MRHNSPVTGINIELPQGANILSTTDAQSFITYVNPDFIKISGFSEAELIGQPHNIVRHPDIPPAAFEHMWSTLKSGKSWMGLIKNRCKNGDHYWVNAYVTPIRKNGNISEYQSVRTKPEHDQIKAAEKLYTHLRAGHPPRTQSNLGLATKLSAFVCFIIALSFLGAYSIFNTNLGSVLLAIGLGCTFSSIAINMFLAPLSMLATKARKIANNPISQILFSGRNDEFGQIDFALRMEQAATGGVIGRIGDAANQLGAYTNSLLSEIDSSNEITREQQAETEQIATAVNQMAASIQEVASNAQNAANAAGKADNETRSGQNLVAHTRDSMQALASDIQQATNVIHQLESNTSEISTVLDVIRSIADQTNLLALNAAIEAARAGEQGRGFAVVADEVRSLAARTQKSTTDIQQMITALQESARSAVSVMEQSREQAQSNVSHAQQAASALDGIGQRVNEITEMNMQIAAAVEQQSAVSESISRSIISIRDAADKNVNTGENNSISASKVAQLTGDMHKLSQHFWEERAV